MAQAAHFCAHWAACPRTEWRLCKKEWYLTHLLKRFDSRNPFKALFHDEGQIECWESYEILKLIYIWDAEQRLQLMSI